MCMCTRLGGGGRGEGCTSEQRQSGEEDREAAHQDDRILCEEPEGRARRSLHGWGHWWTRAKTEKPRRGAAGWGVLATGNKHES